MRSWWLLLLVAAISGRAAADDGHSYLLAEPIDYTDVIDAFDDGDPLDVNIALSFIRRENTSTIAREAPNSDDRIAGRSQPIADSEEIENALQLEVDVGLFKDLMVYARLPLVLSDTRRLQLPSAARCSSSACADQRNKIVDALTPAGPGGGEPLFDLTSGRGYHSATRSGIPAVDLGAAWGILNQYRTPYMPTWVVSAEARISVGDVMTPCTEGMSCRNGISRGTARFQLESRWSYRLRFVEPYLGLSFALERATGASDRFVPHGDEPGYLSTTPP
ncbi:MAG TPA: hypothetical protein VHZ95_21325, partial [Polyangiales bacterium]|nr:hypothetical protein [Polyangiales bacterium]